MLWQIAPPSMLHRRTTLAAKLSSGFGLLVVMAWLLAPILHLWQDNDCHGQRQHDEATCTICQAVFHGAADSTHDAPSVTPAAAQEIFYAAPHAVLICAAPDIRAHASRGPPSA